eukprot:575043-Prorocentrum_minimum.AAC.1
MCIRDRHKFDAVVVDEAAQALEPAVLIPLMLLATGGKVRKVIQIKFWASGVLNSGFALGLGGHLGGTGGGPQAAARNSAVQG